MTWRFHFRGCLQKVFPMAPDDYPWGHSGGPGLQAALNVGPAGHMSTLCLHWVTGIENNKLYSMGKCAK